MCLRAMQGQTEPRVDDMGTERIGSLNLYFAAAQGPALASEQDALDLLVD